MVLRVLSLVLAVTTLVCTDEVAVNGRGLDEAGSYVEPSFKPRLGLFWDLDGSLQERSLNYLSRQLFDKRDVNCNSKKSSIFV